MTKNCLTLSGRVCTTLIQKVSPSGISHHQFILEHRSMQQEGNFLRRAWCWLPIVFSEKKTSKIIRGITNGREIIVRGFISCHQGRNGLSKIVLHANQIDLINSGE